VYVVTTGLQRGKAKSKWNRFEDTVKWQLLPVSGVLTFVQELKYTHVNINELKR
jgi:hypothetical protein